MAQAVAGRMSNIPNIPDILNIPKGQLSAKKARGMFNQMRENVPNWWVYLSSAERDLFYRIGNNGLSDNCVGGKSKIICSLYTQVMKRQVPIFAQRGKKRIMGSPRDDEPIKKVVYRIIIGNAHKDGNNIKKMAGKLGLPKEKVWSLSYDEAFEWNSSAVCYLLENYFDGEKKEFKPEVRLPLLKHIESMRGRTVQSQSCKEWRVAFEELEGILSNPELISTWAPDFRTMEVSFK